MHVNVVINAAAISVDNNYICIHAVTIMIYAKLSSLPPSLVPTPALPTFELFRTDSPIYKCCLQKRKIHKYKYFVLWRRISEDFVQ